MVPALPTLSRPPLLDFHLPAALLYRLIQKGHVECKAYSQAYADCCRGRTLSVIWTCRQQMKELSDCMSTQ